MKLGGFNFWIRFIKDRKRQDTWDKIARSSLQSQSPFAIALRESTCIYYSQFSFFSPDTCSRTLSSLSFCQSLATESLNTPKPAGYASSGLGETFFGDIFLIWMRLVWALIHCTFTVWRGCRWTAVEMLLASLLCVRPLWGICALCYSTLFRVWVRFPTTSFIIVRCRWTHFRAEWPHNDHCTDFF